MTGRRLPEPFHALIVELRLVAQNEVDSLSHLFEEAGALVELLERLVALTRPYKVLLGPKPVLEHTGLIGDLVDSHLLRFIVVDERAQLADLPREAFESDPEGLAGSGIGGDDKHADARVPFKQSSINFLDARNHLLGVDGPALRRLPLGLRLDEHADKNRLNQERRSDQEQRSPVNRQMHHPIMLRSV